MAKNETSLTEMQVRNAKPREKPYKLFDGGGLYLEVAASGSRIWRLKFRQADGKENRLTFGPYPEITLQEAREKRLEARRLMLKGIQPSTATTPNAAQLNSPLTPSKRSHESGTPTSCPRGASALPRT